MLIKLLKYDFRSAAPMFGVGYAALLVLAVLTGTSDGASLYLTAIFGTLYITLTVVVIVATWVGLCVHFYRNLLGSEGYLMNTLPVQGRYLILSKLISGIAWCMASGVVTFVSLMILALSTVSPQSIVQKFMHLRGVGNLDYSWVADFLELLFTMLIELALMLMIFYFAFLLAHMLPRFRGLAATGIIFALVWGITYVFEVYVNSFAVNGLFSNELFQWLSICALSLLFVAALFAVSAWLLERKLNLQ